jgi:hypothetical protein
MSADHPRHPIRAGRFRDGWCAVIGTGIKMVSY